MAKVSKCGVISGQYFPVFRMNTGKYWLEITTYLDTFHAVVNINTLTILAKSSCWDAWLGPECASEGGYKTGFKIQVEISLWQQVKIESFWS